MKTTTKRKTARIEAELAAQSRDTGVPKKELRSICLTKGLKQLRGPGLKITAKKPRNREPKVFWGGIQLSSGEKAASVTVWVIPDHWNMQASRWKKAEARNHPVQTRSEFAAKLRWMRSTGFKVNPKCTLLSNYLHCRILHEIGRPPKKPEPRRSRGKKEVAA